MPLVSIIIPFYKAEAFIGQTLDSLLAQTHTNWEALCVDDHPSDNTAAIVREYVAKDPRIKYLANPKNQGAPAYGRNNGIAHAKGEYITFLDHDDTFLPQKLEKLLKAMEKEQVDFICSNILLVNDQTGKVDGPAWGAVSGNPKRFFAKRLLEGNFVPPNSTLIRASVFEQVGVFDTNLRGADDFDLWYRIARAVPATIFNEPLATWRYQNQSSISANQQLMLKDELAFYQKIVDGPEFTAAEKQEAAQGVRRNHKGMANQLLLAGHYPEAAQAYQQAGLVHFAQAARITPGLFRALYRRRRLTQSQFEPLTLSFGS